MARLPVVGGDDGNWGTILNSFLEVSHNADGSLIPSAVSASGAELTANKGQDSGYASLDSSGLVPSNQLGNPMTALLKDKGGQVFNIKSYGATGDGSTDDTAALNSAITAANSNGGGIVFIPVGTYLVSSAVQVGGGYPGGLIICGVGWNSQIKLANGANSYIFDFGNSSGPVYTPGLVIKDLYLNCNGANQSSSSGGIYARGAIHCKFSHLYVDTPYEAGIRFFQDGTGSYGHHNTIDGQCWFVGGKNAGSGGTGYAILFNQSDENTVISCNFQDNGTSNGSRTQIYDTGAGLQSIISNAFVGGGNGCSFVNTNSVPGRISFMGNKFDSPNDANALELDGNLHSIVGNTFLNIGNGASSSVLAGVYLNGGSWTTISNNTFESGNAFSAAILEAGGANNNQIGMNIYNGSWATNPIVLIGTSSYPGFNLAGATFVTPDLYIGTSTSKFSAHLQAIGSNPNGAFYFNAGIQINNASSLTSGSGAPAVAGSAGDYYLRTDTPSTSNQRIYVCTVSGNPGTWIGIV